MTSLYQFVATSDHPFARSVRRIRRGVRGATLPAPRILVKPMLWCFLALRSVYFFAKRILICEPLFKAYCRRYGRGVRTGVYVHWIQGKGDIIVGDDVLIDGKSNFSFAARFAAHPTLIIGDRSALGHNCRIAIGKQITIGRDCDISSDVWMFDSSGHPSDPQARLDGLPPSPDEVRPIVIEDNVWIASQCIIFPGVTIGKGSIVSAASVVTGDVPPYTMVAGNPARKVRSLLVPAVATEHAARAGPVSVL
jgi:acetyltransferase-like isoleucine patch superfamily enzyme